MPEIQGRHSKKRLNELKAAWTFRAVNAFYGVQFFKHKDNLAFNTFVTAFDFYHAGHFSMKSKSALHSEKGGFVMSKINEFLKKEAMRPVLVFISMIRWLLKQIVLYVLRLVLWSIFFMLPSLMLVFFGFHYFTGKVRNEIQNSASSTKIVRYVPIPSGEAQSGFSMIRTLSQDLRFWILEFERFRR